MRRDQSAGPVGRGALALVDEERTWVARLRAGDARAFEEMYVAYYQPLCAFATACIGSRESSEELVQDVFCRIWQSRHSWYLTEPMVRGYLFNAVRNRALNYLKHQKIEFRFTQWEPPSREMVGAHDAMEVAEFAAAVRCALAGLPPRCREACSLRWQFDLSYREIATTMAISQKSVEGLITRGLKLLRIALRSFA